jgi:hypothetical protein
MPTVTRPSPGITRIIVPDRRAGLERGIRIALGAGIAVQVLQRWLFSGNALSEYGRSLWYVDYSGGFVRRGLAGEALHQLVGGTPSLRTVDLVQNALAGVMLVLGIALVVLLCRRRTIVAYAAAALLVIAPFGFDSLGGQRRPDLVGFVLLAAVGIWLTLRPARPVLFGIVAGGLLATTTLVSEVSPLIVGPWLVLLVGAAARSRPSSGRAPWMAMALAAAPSAAVLAVLAISGRPTPTAVAELQGRAPPEIRGHGSVFSYLADTFGGSVSRVIEGPTRLGVSLVVGALLCALLLWCSRAALPYARATFAWILPTTAMRRGFWIGTAAAATLLFSLGLDTLRWVTSVGFAALLTTSGIVLLTSASPVRPPGSDRWQQPVPSYPMVTIPAMLTIVVGVYLLLLPPLPNWVRDSSAAARLLLDVPR